jgi:MFS family permease
MVGAPPERRRWRHGTARTPRTAPAAPPDVAGTLRARLRRSLGGTRLGRARLGVVAAFAMHAAVAGSFGPRLPAIKARAGLSESALGVALVGFAFGLFAGTRLAGPFVRRFGSRSVIRVTAPTFAVSMIGGAIARDLVSLAIALGVVGVVAGVMDVAMNANAVSVERAAARPIMSGIHGTWSAGLLVGAAAAALAAALDVSPIVHFTVVALVVAPASVPLLRGLLGPGEEPPAPAVGPAPDAAIPSHGRSAVVTLGLIGFGSFIAEGSMHDWSAIYLHETLGASSATAAVGFAGFALGMTASRFVADRLSARFGPVALVRAGGAVAGSALGLGLLVPHPAAGIGAFTILGLAMAPVVPITFSAAGNAGGAAAGAGSRALGWVLTISYVGSMLGPAVIGFVARYTGLRVALAIPAALALGVAALANGVATAQRPASDVPAPHPVG